MTSHHLDAATVPCPHCGAGIGHPCRVRKCRQGIPGCTYKACSVVVDLPEPHFERAFAAKQAER